MTKPMQTLAILIVEDVESDAQLILRLLRKAGYEPAYRQVESEAQMRAALAEQTWDVIVSDYSLPQFNGEAALALLNESGLDIPFLIVSGTMGEETAVRMMKAGANDYLMKDALARLIPAVERELRQAEIRRERRRAEDALRESEARYRRLADHAPDIIFRYDIEPSMKLTYVNPAVQTVTGYSPQECYDDPLLMLNMIYADDKWLMNDYLQRLVPPEDLLFARWVGKDGVVRWMESRIVPIYNADGSLTAVEGITRDITERKKAEQALAASEAELRALVEQTPSIVYTEEVESRHIIYISPQVEKITGYAPAEWLRESAFWKKIIHPEDFDAIVAAEASATAAGEPCQYEYRLIARDGRIVWIRDESALICNREGTPLFWQGVMYDITERKQAEQALTASESELRALVEQVPAIVYTESVNSRVTTYISPQVEKMTGYTPAEWVADRNLWKQIVHPEDLAFLLSEDERTTTTHEPFQIDYRILTRDGRALWIHDEAALIQSQDGTPLFWQGVMYDITERKQAEEKLKASQQRYRQLIEGVNGIVYSFSTKHGNIYYSPHTEDIFGYTPDYLYANPTLSRASIHPDDLERVDAAVQNFIKGSELNIEYRIHDAGGKWHWLADHSIGREVRGDEVIIDGLAIDITERKRAEDALRESQSLYHSLVESSPLSICRKDLEGRFTFANRRFLELSDITLAELVGKTDYDLHPSELAEKYRRDDQAILDSGHVQELIEERTMHGGESTYVQSIKTPIYDGAGKINGIQISFWDITERKRAEERVKASEERHRTILQTAMDGFWLADVDGCLLEVNETYCRMSGYTAQELLTMNISDVEYVETQNAVFAHNERIKARGEDRFETRHRRKDGSVFHVEVSVQYQPTEGGRMVAFLKDITERKQAEELTFQQNEQLRLLYEASQRLNRTLDLQEIYQAVCDFMSSVAPNDGLVISSFDPESQKITCRAFWMDHKWLDVRSFPSIPLEAEGRGTQSLVIRSGQAMLLNDFQAHLRTAQTNYYVDDQTNQIVEELPRGEEDITRSALIVPLKMGNRVSGVVQVTCYRPNAYTENQLKLLEALSLHIASAEQNALLYAQVQKELNERIQAEKSLREREEQYRTLIEQLPAIVFIDDIAVEGGTVYISPQVETILGFSQKEWLEKSPAIWLEQVHPDDREWVHAGYKRCLFNGEPHDAEYRIRAADGRMIWLRDQAIRLSDEHGKPRLIHGVMYDITERKHAEEAIHRRVTELEMLYQSGLALSQLLTPKEIGQKILELLEEKLNWHNTRIRLYHAQDDSLELLDFNQPGLKGETERREVVERIQSLIAHSDQGMNGWVVQHGQPVRLGDVSADPRYVESYPGINSGLYVPMKLGEHIVGVISVEDESLDAFSEADERLIVTLANQAASAFENARLFEETRQRVMELETLNRISLVLRAVARPAEMLSIVLDEALAILNTSHGSIELYNKANDALEQVVARGWLVQVSVSRPSSQGIPGKVFTSGETFISRNFASDPIACSNARAIVPPDWGGICLPIRTTQQVLGVMIVSTPSEREFDRNEIRMLSILSEMTGAALQRMQLHEQTVRRLEQLNALRAVDQAISSSRELRLTLNVLLAQTISQLQVDAADVLLLHPGSNFLELVASHGFHTRLLDSVHLSDSFAGRAILDRRPLMTLDYKAAAQDPQFGRFWKQEGFDSYWCVPLMIKGEIKGVLEVYCRRAFTPDTEWIEFLEALAGQAAIAIDNTQLFENLQRANMDLRLAYDATIEGWSRAMDLRDHETEGHTLRVTDLTVKLARAMRVSESQLTAIRRGALLHDIGKMGVPDAILLKDGQLTDEEWVIMRQHPQFARDMLLPIAYLNDALDIPYSHHEKWNGAGYPQGLAGINIPLAARIFAVVDVWDALTNDRSYRKKWDKPKSSAYLRAESGKHFDPQIVEVFLRMIAEADE